MSTNKHSIIRLVTLFFISTFLLVNILFAIAHQHFYKQYEMEQMQRFLLADRLFHHHKKQDFSIELEQLMIKKSTLSSQKILTRGTLLLELPFGKMLRYEGHTFFINAKPPKPPKEFFKEFAFNPPPMHDFENIVLEDIKPHSLAVFWGVLIAIDALILLFFIYLIQKLLPLHHLKNAIIAFKDGDKELPFTSTSNDEISDITDAFNAKLEKIAAMREARSLFLRNILHEFKTPIMKATLTAECLNPSEEQERLKRIFARMDYLLNEFAKMENFSSGEWSLNKVEYRFVDLLDHVCDLLLCEKSDLRIIGEESQLIVNVDFELFTIALKNIIDNAQKYSNAKPLLTIGKNSISICTKGEQIPKEKQVFSKPFNREFENSSAGLGLGLYISSSILQKHDFHLQYNYIQECNCFEIILT